MFFFKRKLDNNTSSGKPVSVICHKQKMTIKINPLINLFNKQKANVKTNLFIKKMKHLCTGCLKHFAVACRSYFGKHPCASHLPGLVTGGQCGVTHMTPMDNPMAPLSMGFCRQKFWSGLPFPSPENFPDPGIETLCPTEGGSLPFESPGKPLAGVMEILKKKKKPLLLYFSPMFFFCLKGT